MRRFPASKTPLEDVIEGSNAHKEEDHPGREGSRNGCILVTALRQGIHDYGCCNSGYKADYDSRDHTGEKVRYETCTPGLDRSVAHGCPPWLVIQELNDETSTTFTASHI